MFYSDYGVRTYVVHASNYILRWERHYEQFVNAFKVRDVSYNDVVWC